jgi:uncharacterized protein (DUF1697 family)
MTLASPFQALSSVRASSETLYHARVTSAHLTSCPYVALLRGVNVGGRNILPMKDLVGMFTAVGCTDVRTYIQSGNVVFRAGPALARRIPAAISSAISDRFGFQVAVIMRTADELRAIARGNPFLTQGTDVATLSVAFLVDAPDVTRLTRLDPSRSAPDAFAVRGREIYLHCPNGFASTKLTNAYFDAVLETTSTARNWRTVHTLVEMTAASRPESHRDSRSKV